MTTLARLLCRELTLHSDYLRVENKILRSKLPKRTSFTDDVRQHAASWLSARSIAGKEHCAGEG